jgi:FMN-dependent NADH-azoreductase
MEKRILFINACVREESRTLSLCKAFLEAVQKKNMYTVEELRLEDIGLRPFTVSMLQEREEQLAGPDRNIGLLRQAVKFSQANYILIGAPYWDLSFPSALKVYFEHVSVNGICFRYDENGHPIGLCQAEGLLYITTAGGYIGPYDTGWRYVDGLCGALFGIPNRKMVAAEGLDIYGNDVDAILEVARRQVLQLSEELN